ncbi:MAG TPA: hypothetical protein VMU48_00905 [Terracidiphilus sp.]|nr:hypothetical protein [Terracidiphilus sp.]
MGGRPDGELGGGLLAEHALSLLAARVIEHIRQPFFVGLPCFRHLFTKSAKRQGLFAGAFKAALLAILGRLANVLCGCEGLLIGLGGDFAHEIFGLDVGDGRGDLGGNLESVEKKSGTAGVDAGGGERTDDLSECELNSAFVFERRQFEVERLVSGRDGGGAAQVGVEVAEVLIAKSRGVAARSAGQDVSTFFEHGG